MKYLRSKLTIYNIFLVFIIVLVLVINYFVKGAIFTGDEPRFAYYAVSYSRGKDFNMLLEDWYIYEAKNGIRQVLPQIQNSTPGHSVIVPVIVSVLVDKISYSGIRWSSVFISICGILFLYKALILLKFKKSVVLITLLLISTTLPLLPYMKLLYSEIWLFTLVSLTLLLLANLKNNRNLNSLSLINKFIILLVTPLTFSLLPFFHLRLILLCFVLFIIYAFYLFKQIKTINKFSLLIPLFCVGISLVVFVNLQISLYGSVLGSASSPNVFSLNGLVNRTILTLFDVRHGLLTFSPIFIFSFLGLLKGIIKKQIFEILTFIMLLSILIISMWGAASDSFSARFWVASVPILAIGMCNWLSNRKSFLEYIVFVITFVITYVNAFAFVVNPNIFLNNRIYSYTYDRMFDYFPFINVNAILPWDSWDVVKPYLYESNLNGLYIFIYLFIVIISCYLSNSTKKLYRVISYIIFLILISYVLIYTGVKKIPEQTYSVNYSKLNEEYFIINFLDKNVPGMIRFGKPKDYWPMPPYPSEVEIAVSYNGIDYENSEFRRMSPIITFNNPKPVMSMKISGKKELIRYLYDNNKFEIYKKLINL